MNRSKVKHVCYTCKYWQLDKTSYNKHKGCCDNFKVIVKLGFPEYTLQVDCTRDFGCLHWEPIEKKKRKKIFER